MSLHKRYASHVQEFPLLFKDFIQKAFLSRWQTLLFDKKKLEVWVLRLDAQHLHIGGNKLYKLYYNLLEAKNQNKKTILTFGGAYSNHLRATALAASKLGFRSVGVVRGEEHGKKHKPLNPVLSFCREQNMQFHFISRTDYRMKTTRDFIEDVKNKFGNFYLVPEGGSNALALLGTSHIPKIATDLMKKQNLQPIDCFALAIGTGGTSAGVLNGVLQNNLKSKVLAISALKGGDFLRNDILNLLYEFYEKDDINTKSVMQNLILETNFHEGGYAKKSERLANFIEDFNQKNDYEIEFIYTGKAFLAVYELAKKDFFKAGQKIMLIHTGGVF